MSDDPDIKELLKRVNVMQEHMNGAISMLASVIWRSYRKPQEPLGAMWGGKTLETLH